MNIKEHEPLGPKTTMRIGGNARYFADLQTKEDVEEVYKFAREKKLPLIVLGGGSNTIFANGTIEALVIRLKNNQMFRERCLVCVGAGMILASLIKELADQGFDLSPLTGIPGTVGGAVVGNAGQGPKGVWIDSFIKKVVVLQNGEWKTFSKEECKFAYRGSIFKNPEMQGAIIWEIILDVPKGKPETIKVAIEKAFRSRGTNQPHIKTAGSCFKAVKGTPAWELIDKAGLRGLKVGGVRLSEKHANFLINDGDGSFEDVVNIIKEARQKAPELRGVEMRLIGENGEIAI